MEIAHLKAFVAVAEERNVGRAAARLHLTASPVSRAIRELERQMNTPLLVRKHHDIQLTPAGQHMLDGARKILRELHELEASVRATGADARPTVVGATPFAPAPLIDRVIGTIRAHAIDHAVDLVTEASPALISAVGDGRLDTALVHLPVAEPGLSTVVLGHQEFDVAMRTGHRLASRAELSPSDLQGIEVLLTSRRLQPLGMKRIIDFLEGQGAGPIHQMDSDIVVLAATIRRTDKVTLTSSSPGSTLRRVFTGTEYARVPLRHERVRLQAGLVWRRAAELPDWLRESIAALSA